MRAFNFFLICTSFLALILVYGQKYRTEDVQTQVIELQSKIDQKLQIMSALEADWAYLNQPGRMQAIVDRHAETLNIAQINATQYGRFEDLPMRPAEPDQQGLDALLSSLEAGIDPNELAGLSSQ